MIFRALWSKMKNLSFFQTFFRKIKKWTKINVQFPDFLTLLKTLFFYFFINGNKIYLRIYLYIMQFTVIKKHCQIIFVTTNNRI